MSWKAMRDVLDGDALLERMGLERRTPTGDLFTGLGLFSVGVLVGAALGLMFAPRRGHELRAKLNEALRTRGRTGEELQQVGKEIAGEAGVPTGAPAH